MHRAPTLRAKHRLPVSGRAALFVAVMLAAGIVAILAELGWLPVSSGYWPIDAFNLACTGALALAGGLIWTCCLGSVLEFLAPPPSAERVVYSILITGACAPLPWRVCPGLRPPCFSH